MYDGLLEGLINTTDVLYKKINFSSLYLVLGSLLNSKITRMHCNTTVSFCSTFVQVYRKLGLKGVLKIKFAFLVYL